MKPHSNHWRIDVAKARAVKESDLEKVIRLLKLFNLSDVARETKVSYSAVRRIASGQTGKPHGDTVRILLVHLNKQVDYMSGCGGVAK